MRSGIIVLADWTWEALSGTKSFLTTLGRQFSRSTDLVCRLHECLIHHLRGWISCGIMFGYTEYFRLLADVEELIDQIVWDWGWLNTSVPRRATWPVMRNFFASQVIGVPYAVDVHRCAKYRSGGVENLRNRTRGVYGCRYRIA